LKLNFGDDHTDQTVDILDSQHSGDKIAAGKDDTILCLAHRQKNPSPAVSSKRRVGGRLRAGLCEHEASATVCLLEAGRDETFLCLPENPSPQPPPRSCFPLRVSRASWRGVVATFARTWVCTRVGRQPTLWRAWLLEAGRDDTFLCLPENPSPSPLPEAERGDRSRARRPCHEDSQRRCCPSTDPQRIVRVVGALMPLWSGS
jgi:hypothetical protein